MGWWMGNGRIRLGIYGCILGIVLLIKLVMGSAESKGKTETALDVLKKRYARGQINKEEFEEKKKDIGS